ncbi:MAG: rod shape-determining protein RodA [Bacteroidota bacterium]
MSVTRSLTGGGAKKKIDWILFSMYLGLVALGCVSIYSATVGEDLGGLSELWATPAGKQIIWVGISLVAMFVIQFLPGDFWERFAFVIYIVSIILLILVLFFGSEIKGARSWFRIGSFGFQPSEVAKFACCLAIASFLNNYRTDISKTRFLLAVVGLIVVPILLILQQPDAGSALIFTSFVILFYRAGMSPTYIYIGLYLAAIFLLAVAVDEVLYVILGLLIVGSLIFLSQFKKQFYFIAFGILLGVVSFVSLSPRALGEPIDNTSKFVLVSNALVFVGLAVYHYLNKKQRVVSFLTLVLLVSSGIAFSTSYAFNNFLESHQQDRLNMWLRPDRCDPSGPIYNLNQSRLAIGSGGFKGKGLFEGTLTKLDYVPEQSTDFIFSVIGEEHGFIGSIVLIGLFSLFFTRIIQLAERQRSNFSRFYAYGVLGIFFVHFFINVGMTMGLMPIIGIPLPFISKGGSSLLGFTIMIGVLLSLDSRRYFMR